ncbi:MAG: DUF805 domain-containing protein [Pseudolabrys sp.]
MSFVEAISSCFRNYANFTGRAVRSEFWYWYIFVAIVLIVFGVLALILPSLAVSVRRLHDIDRTGWWVLIAATAIGTLVLIYWACVPGTSDRNRFG